MQITFETGEINTGFHVLRQGVPEGRSSEGYASFKQVKSWPWREGKKERVHFSTKPRGERLGEREKRRQRQKESIQRLTKREREMGGGGGERERERERERAGD